MAKDTNPNTPMYGSFRSFDNFIEHVRQHQPMPSRIDKTYMSHLNYGTRQALMAGMRFLGLLGDGDVPTTWMEELVAAGDADRPTIMLKVLQRAYPYFFKDFDLGRATHGQIVEKIRTEGNVSGSTIEKTLAFFLAAAQAAGIKLSPHVTGRKAPGTGPRVNRAKKKPAAAKVEDAGGGKGKTAADGDEDKGDNGKVDEVVADPWLTKYPDFNPTWDAAIQASWFEGFAKLMELRRGGEKK